MLYLSVRTFFIGSLEMMIVNFVGCGWGCGCGWNTAGRAATIQNEVRQ